MSSMSSPENQGASIPLTQLILAKCIYTSEELPCHFCKERNLGNCIKVSPNKVSPQKSRRFGGLPSATSQQESLCVRYGKPRLALPLDPLIRQLGSNKPASSVAR